MTSPRHQSRAKLIRRASDSAHLEELLRRVVRVLADDGIPSIVIGGYAVQEHGYPRFTANLDLVVPDTTRAREVLDASGLTVGINLLPGGGSLGPTHLPMPEALSVEPLIIDLATLIGLKLSSYVGARVSRARDMAGVVELTKASHLPREFPAESSVRQEYQTLWDGLERERAASVTCSSPTQPRSPVRR